jgi:glycosyltransferase involved in cell wall biosynthesis
MRILLVTGSYPPMKCGVGDYTASLAESLAEAGHEIAVLTSIDAASRPTNEKVAVFPIIRVWAWWEHKAALQAIQAWRPDIVHIQFPTLGYADGKLPWRLPLLLRAHGIPIAQTWHEFLPDAGLPRLANIAMAISPGPTVVVRPHFRRQMPLWFKALSAPKTFELIPNAPTIPPSTLNSVQRAAIRAEYLRGGSRLIAFFGFLYEHKGIDDLLSILDPTQDRLLLIGEVKDWDPYQIALVKRLSEAPFLDFVQLTGYLTAEKVSDLLAAADAIALPYRNGGGSWNTSLQAAILQGTFVLTTSNEQHGFDQDINVYYARPGDLNDYRSALALHAGKRPAATNPERMPLTWPEIVKRHVGLYRSYLSNKTAS